MKKILTDEELFLKANNFLLENDGDYWKLLDRYSDGTALIEYGKNGNECKTIV